MEKHYMIVKPFQLPWDRVSPLDENGLEYHLTPELSILVNGIVSGDVDFKISHAILGIENVEASEIEAQEIFLHEFLPNKSQERIQKSFRDEGISCFFKRPHMEYLNELFTEKNFMSHDVKIAYKGRRIEDVVMLPPKEFNLILEAFDELNVQASYDFRVSKEEFKEEYQQYFKEKVAAADDKNKQTVRERMKNKGVVKKTILSVGAAASGVAGFIFRSKVAALPGIHFKVLGVLIGTVSIVLETYGRQEVQSLLRMLKSGDNFDRGVFG